jgi:hypothetical protein
LPPRSQPLETSASGAGTHDAYPSDMTDLDDLTLATVAGGAQACTAWDRVTGTAQGVANAFAGSTRKLIAGTQLSKQTLPEYEDSLKKIEYPVPACRPW